MLQWLHVEIGEPLPKGLAYARWHPFLQHSLEHDWGFLMQTRAKLAWFPCQLCVTT
jgi:hypothetical protein